jgi:hypothetical protein
VIGLERFGLRPRPLQALAFSYILQDLRSQHFGRATATKPGELLPPLFWVVGQYIIASGLMSGALFMRVDAGPFAASALALSFLLTATAVIVEFNEVVLSPDDLFVVGHRPVGRATYAAARLINLGFFALLVTLSLNLIPAVLGAFLRDSGPAFTPLYLATAVVANLMVVSLTVLAYSAGAAFAGRDEMKDVLAWTQIVVILILFYGAQFMFRDSSHGLERFLSRPPEAVQWLPPFLLGGFIAEAVAGGLAWAHARLLVLLAVLLVLVVLLVLLRLQGFYQQIAQADQVSAHVQRRPRPLVGALARRLAKSRAQAAVLGLAFTQLRRDGDLRMRTLPSLGTVLALAVLGLASGQLGNPFDADPTDGTVSLAVVQVLVLSVPAMLQSLAFSRDHEASWLLRTAPGRARVQAHAARLAVTWGIAMPALFALGVTFAVAWRDPLSAALATAMGALQVLAVSHASLPALGFERPFAQASARGDLAGRVAPWTAAVATIGVAIAGVQYLAAGRLVWLAACLAVLAGGLLYSRKVAAA